MKKAIKNLTLSAMFMALGLILPFLTGQVPRFGAMMLPMHIPVLLCGLICGWQYGGVIGFILPLFRFALFSMPPIYPIGISMSFELATYGILSGYLFSHARWQCVFSLYRCLIASMIGGRVVWGMVRFLFGSVSGTVFTWKAFMAGAFLEAIPGIVVQLILIPTIMVALNKAGLVYFYKEKRDTAKAI